MILEIIQFIKAENIQNYMLGKATINRIKGYNLMSCGRIEYKSFGFWKKLYISYFSSKENYDDYFFGVLTKKEYQVGNVIEVELVPFSIQTTFALIKGEDIY